MTTPHPAQYSTVLLAPMVEMLQDRAEGVLYDPMAGAGVRLKLIANTLGLDCTGSEIEAEFIFPGTGVVHRDCLTYFGGHQAIVTSPAYANRMADSYLGTPAEQALRAETGKIPRRRSYAIALGRKLTPGNGGALHWGPGYRELHTRIFTHVVKVNMEPDGLLLLNVASHFKGIDYRPVAEWYKGTLEGLGLTLIEHREVETPGFRDGQNSESRVGAEHLMLFRNFRG